MPICLNGEWIIYPSFPILFLTLLNICNCFLFDIIEASTVLVKFLKLSGLIILWSHQYLPDCAYFLFHICVVYPFTFQISQLSQKVTKIPSLHHTAWWFQGKKFIINLAGCITIQRLKMGEKPSCIYTLLF